MLTLRGALVGTKMRRNDSLRVMDVSSCVGGHLSQCKKCLVDWYNGHEGEDSNDV